jgi:iron complex transport system permease protein
LAQRALFLHRDPVPVAARAIRLALLPAVLVVALLLGTAFGAVTIAPAETFHIVLYKIGIHLGPVTWSPADESIIWQIRLPRALAAALVGAALGVAGTLFQAVLRNPLADPYVIGTSAGAQLGVVVALIVPIQISVFGFGTVQALAFVGAVATVGFVYVLARASGRTPIVTLLLAGFVISSFLISGTSFLSIVNNRLADVVLWTMGSLDVSESAQLAVSAPLIVVAALAAVALGPKLDVILLGEEQAQSLGLRVESVKLGVIVLACFLTALAVTLAGIVAFVGLIVPHAARLLYGPGHRTLIPTAALGGASFVVLADLIARVAIAPSEIPLGVITALLGAPLFLHLLRRSRHEYSL